MANSIDFRADQVQTSKIIVTGSTPQKTLLIYGIGADAAAPNNNQGNINQTVFPSNTLINSDMFLFVSGAVNSRGASTPSIAVFGGDVGIYGAFYQGPISILKGGAYSHAQGFNTWAAGDYSHAEGISTFALFSGSHAEGSATFAGQIAHAEGALTIAHGTGSHAEGIGTVASGVYSHAEGISTVAYGDYSHAEGFATVASGSAQTVVGLYNKQGNTESLFVVGCGTGESDRQDIFRANVQTIVLSGGVIHKTNLIKTDYTILPTDRFVFITVTGMDRTVTLPAASSIQIGHTVTIRKVDANNNNVLTISASSGVEYISGKDNINTANSVEIPKSIPSGSVTLVYCGDKFNTNFDLAFTDKPTWFITEYSTNTWT